ncbi:hypothetical protein, partial [Ileibacterium valens]
AGLRLILAMISFPLFLIKAQIAKKICAGRAVRSRLTQIKLHSLKLLASGLSREAVANFLEISNAHLELVLSKDDK